MSYYSDSSYDHRSHSHSHPQSYPHSHSHSHSHPHPQHRHHSSSVYMPGPPVDADPQLWQYFSAVDTNRSGALSINELQHALVNGNWSEFDTDTVKMLMNMFDSDRNGTIGFSEFTRLWNYIVEWQRVFRHFDRDHSGTIERRELSDALRNFGYQLSPPLLTLLERKYASGAVSVYGSPPGITFDRFVRACVTVKTLTEAFQKFNSGDGYARFRYDDFMRVTLAAP